MCNHKDVEVLKRRGREITYRCKDCGEVFVLVEEKEVEVPIIISRHEKSEKKVLKVKKNQEFKVGDLVTVSGENVEISAIDAHKRVGKSRARNIKALWGVSLDFPKIVGLSIHYPKRTISKKIILLDKTYSSGEVLGLQDKGFEIKKIKTFRGVRGKAEKDEIQRIYTVPTDKKPEKFLRLYDEKTGIN